VKMKLAAILLLALFLTGCHHAEQTAYRLTPISPPALIKTAPSNVPPAFVSPISAITLQREPGMTNHPLPAYAVTLRSDGTATYIGSAFSRRISTHSATVLPAEFARLARLIEESNFVGLGSFYGPLADDISQVSVSVVSNGKRKTVVDYGTPFQSKYGKEAPTALKQIEQQINAIVANVKWTKVSEES